MGMEDAQRQYLSRGIVVTYEYLAPEAAAAEDQKNRLMAAAREELEAEIRQNSENASKEMMKLAEVAICGNSEH